jgi:4-amino-4-deoxy-L-arabinose transferase-like glycosyltransferase
LGFLFIALDPFHIGLTRLLHLDGLLSNLMLLSLLALLHYMQNRRFLSLGISGVIAGLSWLTKSPGFFLIPIAGILFLLETIREMRTESIPWLRSFWRWTIIGSVWVLIGAFIFFALWPSMWVDPIGSFSRVLGMARSYAEEGHASPVFFNGQLFADGSIGPEYVHFYAYTFAWRATPVVIVGLFLALTAFILRRDLLVPGIENRTFVGLILLISIFYIIMTLGSKKFDRYFLPAHGPLLLIAAAGWSALFRWLVERFQNRSAALRSEWAVPALVLLPALIHSIGAIDTAPYYLSYYNPLLGGARVAPRVMQIGWGEGLDQAARYLNQKPNLGNLHVSSWYALGSFSYFFKGHSHYIHANLEISDNQMEEVLERQYAVVYIHQWQRHTPERLLELLSRYEPEKTIWIDGIEYVRIYNMRDIRE